MKRLLANHLGPVSSPLSPDPSPRKRGEGRWSWDRLLGLFLVIGLLGSSARAQGLLVVTNAPEPVPLPRPVVRPHPMPPMSYKIKELAVNARLLDQVARVQVSQTFVNTGSLQMEVSFIFPLGCPYQPGGL